MATIYKQGTKWVVNQYRLDAGSCLVVETDNELSITIKLKSTLATIVYAAYTDFENESGVAYTKATLLPVLDEFINGAGQASGTPDILEVELTRPANTTAYTANDAIGAETAQVKQVSVVTLTGTGGSATITGTSGISRTVLFNTSLTQTATDFATAYSDDYTDITVTGSGETIVFTADNFDETFTEPVIANVSEDLTGTVTHTTANVAAEAQVDTISLTGATGTAEFTLAGGLTKVVTFAEAGTTDLTQTASDFVTSWAADYLVEGIVVTSSAADIIFTANVAGVAFVSPEIANTSGDLAGTVANTNANVVAVAQVETILVEGTEGAFTIEDAGGLTSVVTFVSSVAITTANFAVTNAAAYLAEGIVLTYTATQIVMTAEVPGTGFTAPTISGTTEDLAGTVATTASVSLLPLELENAADAAGRGGVIMGLKLETDITAAAGTDFRLWFFNDTPSGVVGDNVTYANLYANKSKLLFYVDVTMDALLGASDTVIGLVDLAKEYNVIGTSLYCIIQTVTGFTPTSEGNITVTLNTLKL